MTKFNIDLLDKLFIKFMPVAFCLTAISLGLFYFGKAKGDKALIFCMIVFTGVGIIGLQAKLRVKALNKETET